MKGFLNLDIVYLVNHIPGKLIKLLVLLKNVDQTKSFYQMDLVRHVKTLQVKLIPRHVHQINAESMRDL